MAVEQVVEVIRQIVDRYIKILEANGVRPQRVYLFGSHINGNADEHSDIDLAIVSDSFSGSRFRDRELLMRLRRPVDLRIEPHPFLPEEFTADNPEAAEIVSSGLLLF
ncbi:MAG: nucleotidyltransferase domain-containing protein [bacterium]